MLERLLDDANDPHPIRSWWLKVNKKRISIASGSVVIVCTIGVILIVVFAGPSSVEIDADSPGTPLPRKCGQRTTESNWPWVVEIYVRDGSNWKHSIAVGTVVNDRYVLSSLYVLERFYDNELRVLLGETSIVRTVDDSYFENRVYQDIVKKEFFKSESFGYEVVINISLLKMDQAVQFDGRIQPICLPWVHPEIPKQLLILPDEGDKLFNTLAHLVDYEKCYELWFWDDFELDEESRLMHLCAKQSSSDELPCYALRGSPLLGVFADNGKDRYVQYGIKHFGDCTIKLQIYTNITHKIEWIRETISQQN